jgi:hypothetical protein
MDSKAREEELRRKAEEVRQKLSTPCNGFTHVAGVGFVP